MYFQNIEYEEQDLNITIYCSPIHMKFPIKENISSPQYCREFKIYSYSNLILSIYPNE